MRIWTEHEESRLFPEVSCVRAHLQPSFQGVVIHRDKPLFPDCCSMMTRRGKSPLRERMILVSFVLWYMVFDVCAKYKNNKKYQVMQI